MMTMSSLKPVNALSGGTMPTSDGGQQRQHRDEVVAQPPPDEQAHRGGDDAEGELREGHAGSRGIGDPGRDSGKRGRGAGVAVPGC